jgi:hypothetical protein
VIIIIKKKPKTGVVVLENIFTLSHFSKMTQVKTTQKAGFCVV